MTTIVALQSAIIIVLMALVVYLSREMSRQRRDQVRLAREARGAEQGLIDRIMYMADKPWQVPETSNESEEVYESEEIIYPEQMPEDFTFAEIDLTIPHSRV